MLEALDLGVVDVVAAVVKALSLIALLQAIGLALFSLIYGQALHRSLATLRFVTRSACTAGVVLLIVNQCLVAARMGGEWSALSDLNLQSMAWNSSQALSTVLRVIALICVAIGTAREPLFNRSWFAPSLTLAAISFPISGHIFAHPQRPLLTPLIVAHVLLVTYWLGGVYGLLLTARNEAIAVTASVTHRFSIHATIAVPIIAIAGAAMAFVMLPNVAALFKPYGLLLLAKSTGFALLMVVAAGNKFLLGPALLRNGAASTKRFTTALRVEYVLMIAVIVVTAAMTSWFSPE